MLIILFTTGWQTANNFSQFVSVLGVLRQKIWGNSWCSIHRMLAGHYSLDSKSVGSHVERSMFGQTICCTGLGCQAALSTSCRAIQNIASNLAQLQRNHLEHVGKLTFWRLPPRSPPLRPPCWPKKGEREFIYCESSQNDLIYFQFQQAHVQVRMQIKIHLQSGRTRQSHVHQSHVHHALLSMKWLDIVMLLCQHLSTLPLGFVSTTSSDACCGKRQPS